MTAEQIEWLASLTVAKWYAAMPEAHNWAIGDEGLRSLESHIQKAIQQALSPLTVGAEEKMTAEQDRLLLELVGLHDQIEKGHYLNVHFRAFRLAHDAWLEHIRQNALSGSRSGHSPGGAVLDDQRDGRD
jgi:hypothetical protein